ncbi:TIGR02444 family protein [Eionea flava]
MARMIALWTFACKLYSEPSVKSACLALQDQYGVNVPLLLTACWVSKHNIVLSPEVAEHLYSRAAQWESGCIEPLRRLRRDMKMVHTNNLDDGSGNSHECSQWSHVREQVKNVELAAEKALLGALEQVVMASCSVGASVNVATQSVVMNIHHCIPHLLTADSSRSSSTAVVVSSLATIIHAVNPLIQYDDVFAQVERHWV